MVVNASELPSEDYYDYIVVGGGTAGCPLAATLSQSFRVLLLERGGVGNGDPNLMNQEGFLANLLNTETRDSPAQTFISEEGIPNTCGHVLGGSNAINAGFYNRADSDFFAWSNMLLPTTVSLCIMRRESRLWSTFDDTSRKHISDDLLRYARASNIKI